MSHPVITAALAALFLELGQTPQGSVTTALETQGVVMPCEGVTVVCTYPKEIRLELGEAGDAHHLQVYEHPDARYLQLGNSLKLRPDASPEAQKELFNRVIAIAAEIGLTAHFGANRLVMIVDAVTMGFNWPLENRPQMFNDLLTLEKTLPAIPRSL